MVRIRTPWPSTCRTDGEWKWITIPFRDVRFGNRQTRRPTFALARHGRVYRPPGVHQENGVEPVDV